MTIFGGCMKKVIIIIGIIIMIPFVGFGLYAFDLFYYEAKSGKAEKAALTYLEKKYQEKFEIVEAKYTKALGDETGMFQIEAIPVKNKDIIIRLYANEKFEIDGDDYKDTKWRDEAIDEYQKILEPIFPTFGKMFVNPSFPEEIKNQYALADTYHSILTNHPNQVREYIDFITFSEMDYIEEEKEWNKIYQLIETVKKRPLKEFDIQIDYFPNRLLKTFQEMDESENFQWKYGQDRLLFCRFSSDQIKDAGSASELGAYCRK
jgi:hypothetical protein